MSASEMNEDAVQRQAGQAPGGKVRPVRRTTYGRATRITDPDYGLDFGCELDREQDETIREIREALEAKVQAGEQRRRAEAEAKAKPPRLGPPRKKRRAQAPPADSRRAAMKVYGRAMARCERVFDRLIDYDERALDLSDKLLALDLTQGLARSIAALGNAFNRLCLANKHHLTIDRGAAQRTRRGA